MQELNSRLESLIHRFRVAGAPLVLDVASGAVALLDEVAWDVLPFAVNGMRVPGDITRLHGAAACASACDEVADLVKEGFFLSRDPLEMDGCAGRDLGHIPGSEKARPSGIKALCLYVTDLCNMRCEYCFASGAAYATPGAGNAPPAGAHRHAPGGMMPREVARRAVDFLFENRGRRESVDIDFFGGEPLLNWEVAGDTIAYAREKGRGEGVKVGLTLTTNATLLTPEICDYLNDSEVNMVVSIDGRPEVHDGVRTLASGGSSYGDALRGARLLASSRTPGAAGTPRASRSHSNDPYLYVRGTYTHRNLRFVDDVIYLLDLGFDCISMEPVVCSGGHPCAITASDLPVLSREYERLALEYVRRAGSGRPFRFFHFEIDLRGGPCAARRMSGCGAGRDYLAVSPGGLLYPCHQFIGRDGFAMGDVWDGVTRPSLRERFGAAGVATKPKCRQCWARYACGGGCHANAHLMSGSIDEPYDIGCELQKKRIECAIYTRAMLARGRVQGRA
ncbi:MAG: thioether cross-link-forming SCIFF peptide maturase [Firmicutes bacterium]|nr:thioether cross-link-forming SCIFF peptide maturase [Bacillota bacterium]